MKTLLHIDSSIYSAEGESSRFARIFVDAWRARHPGARVIERDLAAEPVPHLDAETFRAFTIAPAARSDEQRARVALSDRLIAELEAADVIVLGVPMYNFQLPSTLKAYFDHIARAGITFRYTETGSVGLLGGKEAYVMMARGGVYGGSALDTQTPYIKNFLAFLGIENVHFVTAEGLALGEAPKRVALAQTAHAIRLLNVDQREAA